MEKWDNFAFRLPAITSRHTFRSRSGSLAMLAAIRRVVYNSCTSPYANKPIHTTLTTNAVARPASGQARAHNVNRALGETILWPVLMKSSPNLVS